MEEAEKSEHSKLLIRCKMMQPPWESLAVPQNVKHSFTT